MNWSSAAEKTLEQLLDDAGKIAILTVNGRAAPDLSPLGQGRIYFDMTANLFKVSVNGGAYGNLVGGGGGGGGDALVANPLSQFAATTSLQLLGVISDETGTGKLAFATAPTLTSPHVATSLLLDQTTAAYTLTWANPAAARAISLTDPGGTDSFVWLAASQALTGKTYNGLTLTSQAVGFTIAGGTTSKTLTVPLDASVSGTNTGDQSLPVGANPTATVSGSAVNGAAATFMRSDGAPALANTTVTSNPYGSATQSPTFTVDAQGRLTAAANVTITQPLAANPTSTIGNSIVNGSAATFMRSDGAPNIATTLALQLGSLGLGVAAPTVVGQHSQTETASTGTVAPLLLLTAAAHTALTASTERFDISLPAVTHQWATGPLTLQERVRLVGETLTAVGASTFTDSATLSVSPPIKSTNVTATNVHAIYVPVTAVSTATNSYGLTINAATGATNNYAAMFLGGNVGIGTAGPTDKLEVSGSIRSSGGGSFYVGANAGLSGAYGSTLYINANTGTSTIEFGGTTLKLFNPSMAYMAYTFNLNSASLGFTSGNVGIGTTSPLTKLDVTNGTANVVGDTANATILTAANQTSSNANLVINTSDAQGIDLGGSISLGGLYQASQRNPAAWAVIKGGKTNATDTNYSGYLTFGTRNNGSSIVERMRIDNLGNIGIGITSPTAVLHIKAGTTVAATAPLKFNSGSLMTTAEAGAVEFLTDEFFATITTAAARKTIAWIPAQTDVTGSRVLNTTYTAPATRSILVCATVRCAITLAGGNAYVQGKSDASTPPTTVASGIVGIQSGLLNEDNTFEVCFVVAPGKKYIIVSSGTNGTITLGSWFEVAF